MIRNTYVEAIRSRPVSIAKVVAVLAVLVGIVHWTMPDPLAPYAVGALVASFGWMMHISISDATGLANRRVGLMAEVWTVGELNRLDSGWTHVHHVMLQHVDIDHVTIGPGGTFAIDTKFRADWNRQDLKQLAASARRNASQLAPRVSCPSGRITPMIVMWGPQIGPSSSLRKVDGVMFVPGSRIADHLDQLERVQSRETSDDTLAALDSYVSTRDIGEVREHGPIPRPVPSFLDETFGLFAAVIVPATGAGLLLRPEPVGIASAVFLAACAVAAVTIRWRTPIGPIARIATATTTTCCALLALLAAAFVATAL